MFCVATNNLTINSFVTHKRSELCVVRLRFCSTSKRTLPRRTVPFPVMCRITIDGTIAQFSCKCDIHPDLWNIKSNRASGKSTVALETNRFLDKIRVGINAKYKEIAERDNYVSPRK